MRAFCKIRNGFTLGICGLACLVLPALAVAGTDASTAATKPAATSTTRKHSTGASTNSLHSSTHNTAQKTKSKSSRSKKGSKSAKKRGQQVIDGARAQAIQEALIREHYMQGEPSGAWDSATQAAMQRYQADQGWQSKTTPDSRALIKLGLGPSHDHLLNPESAMTTAPAAGVSKAAGKPVPSENNVPQR